MSQYSEFCCHKPLCYLFIITVVYFVIDSVRKLMNTRPYCQVFR